MLTYAGKLYKWNQSGAETKFEICLYLTTVVSGSLLSNIAYIINIA